MAERRFCSFKDNFLSGAGAFVRINYFTQSPVYIFLYSFVIVITKLTDEI